MGEIGGERIGLALRVRERRRQMLEKSQQRKTDVNEQVRHVGVGASGRMRDSKMKYWRSSRLYNNNNNKLIIIQML